MSRPIQFRREVVDDVRKLTSLLGCSVTDAIALVAVGAALIFLVRTKAVLAQQSLGLREHIWLYIEECPDALRSKDDAAAVGIRLDQVIDLRLCQQLFDLQSFLQLLRDEEQRQFAFAKKVGLLPHA